MDLLRCEICRPHGFRPPPGSRAGRRQSSVLLLPLLLAALADAPHQCSMHRAASLRSGASSAVRCRAVSELRRGGTPRRHYGPAKAGTLPGKVGECSSRPRRQLRVNALVVARPLLRGPIDRQITRCKARSPLLTSSSARTHTDASEHDRKVRGDGVVVTSGPFTAQSIRGEFPILAQIDSDPNDTRIFLDGPGGTQVLHFQRICWSLFDHFWPIFGLMCCMVGSEQVHGGVVDGMSDALINKMSNIGCNYTCTPLSPLISRDYFERMPVLCLQTTTRPRSTAWILSTPPGPPAPISSTAIARKLSMARQ